MRKASIRDLHIHTSELVRDAEDGSVIVIERRGEPVAELRAFTAPVGLSAEARARIIDEMKELRAKVPPSNDVDRIIEEDRDR
jgi:antitoxin (DNA-binding transcriptional repressor) of toxin-antitoxin stability system